MRGDYCQNNPPYEIIYLVQIPPSRFPTEPTLYFNTDLYPTASTCGMELALPSIYDRYANFKRNMDIALENHGGFRKW